MWVRRCVASILDHADLFFSLTQAYFFLNYFCLDSIGVLWCYPTERELDAIGVFVVLKGLTGLCIEFSPVDKQASTP